MGQVPPVCGLGSWYSVALLLFGTAPVGLQSGYAPQVWHGLQWRVQGGLDVLSVVLGWVALAQCGRCAYWLEFSRCLCSLALSGVRWEVHELYAYDVVLCYGIP